MRPGDGAMPRTAAEHRERSQRPRIKGLSRCRGHVTAVLSGRGIDDAVVAEVALDELIERRYTDSGERGHCSCHDRDIVDVEWKELASGSQPASDGSCLALRYDGLAGPRSLQPRSAGRVDSVRDSFEVRPHLLQNPGLKAAVPGLVGQ